MGGTYTLKVTTDFASAHILRGYDGPCSRMHGHNWKVEVEARASSLDEMGMGIDFKVLKQATHSVVKRLDHQFLNDIYPFNDLNPTAENIAAHLHKVLCMKINDRRVRVVAVTLWETDRASVRYAEENTT